MKNIDYTTVLVELVNEPVKIILWWIILRNPGITAKELKKEVNLKGNTVYYYLTQLENLHLIDASLETVPNSNLNRKRYSISKSFVESRQTGVLAQQLSGQDKDILLFELLLMNTLLYQTILNLKPLSKNDFATRLIAGLAPFGELFLINAEDVEKIQKIFEELRTINKKYAQGIDLQSASQLATHGVIFACIPLL